MDDILICMQSMQLIEAIENANLDYGRQLITIVLVSLYHQVSVVLQEIEDQIIRTA